MNIFDDNDECGSDDGKIKQKKTTKLNCSLDKAEFLRCCVGLVARKNIPFRIFDDEEYFKKILEPYEEKFHTNLNSKNILPVLDKASKQIKAEISQIVENKMISLKIDIATRLGRSVLGVNIQYVRDYKIHINTIGMIETTKRHTAENLKEEILKCLNEYDINIDEIYSNTTDNGPNVIKMSKLLQEMQQDNILNEEDIETDHDETENIHSKIASVFSVVRCAAHTIQLAAHDVMKTIEDDIKECRNIAKKLRTSVRSSNTEITIPCLDNATRWNSTYDMITSILNIKDYIDNLDSASHSIDVNWSFVKNFLAAFQPVSECTIKLQHEQYVIGDFFRDWLTCELELDSLSSSNLYAEALLNAMKKRRDALMQNNAFIAALYLDPRFNFKETPLLSHNQKQAAVEHLIRTHEMIVKVGKTSEYQHDSESPDIPSQALLDELPSTSGGRYGLLTLHVNAMRNAQGPSPQRREIGLKDQLIKLCERDMEPFDSNILDYSRKFYRSNLEMLQLTEVVLAIPATQVSVERGFSGLSTILTKLRTKLSKKSLANLLITKLNFDLLNFSTLYMEDSN